MSKTTIRALCGGAALCVAACAGLDGPASGPTNARGVVLEPVRSADMWSALDDGRAFFAPNPPEGREVGRWRSALGLDCARIETPRAGAPRGRDTVISCAQPGGWLVLRDHAYGAVEL